MSETFATERGPAHAHVAARLADEGVPLGAIARALKIPFRDAHDIASRAKSSGEIVDIPPRDWPVGQRRYSPGTIPQSAGPVTPTRLNIEEAREAIPFAFHLTRREAEVLAGLMTRDLAMKNWLHGVLYEGRDDGGADPKIIDVVICNIRKKIAVFGVVIETVWGRGYRIEPAVRDRIIALKRAEQMAP